jgi:hypothetical protein
MVEKQTTDRQVAAFGRFLKLLPHGKDLTLVILKGHLLIEEQVRQIIDERVKKPDALHSADLTCYQAICIAEALCPENAYIWTPVKKLNRIRNDLAHKVEPAGLGDRIDDFVGSVPWLDHPTEDPQKRFELKIWALFEAVSSLVERPTAMVLELRKPE